MDYTPCRLLILFALVYDCTFHLLLPNLEVALSFDTFTFVFVYPECSPNEREQQPFVGGVTNFKIEQESLLVVSRISTQSEKIQIVGLLPRTRRRISRVRSIISGVKL